MSAVSTVDVAAVLRLADLIDDVTDDERRSRDTVRAALAAAGGRIGPRCTCRIVAGRPARSADIDPACPVHIPTDPKDPTP